MNWPPPNLHQCRKCKLVYFSCDCHRERTSHVQETDEHALKVSEWLHARGVPNSGRVQKLRCEIEEQKFHKLRGDE